MATSERILILSSRTGGGHTSAAIALEESFLRLGAGHAVVNVTQVLEEAHMLTRHFAGFYNYLLRHHQHAMRYYYHFIERVKPYESHLIFQLAQRYGLQLLDRFGPTRLVSVHPMTQHFFAYVLRKLRLTDKIPLVTVVTDPVGGFWQGWACDAVSRYYVASDSAAEQLEAYGVHSDKIRITGMPVHARFQPLPTLADKHHLRAQLQLDPQRFTVLVNAGWAGGGNIPNLYGTLLQLAQTQPIQLVLMTGHNTALRDQAQALAKHCPSPVKVLGFTENVDAWMNASDVMISKLGGLTTFEAMACHLPILADCLTPPMPQEAGTAQYIQAAGAGQLITDAGVLTQVLEALMHDPLAYESMRANAAQIGSPGAVDVIAREILAGSL